MRQNPYLTGQKLYGDDFGPADISQWFQEEQTGYYDISHGEAQRRPEYDALNRLVLYGALDGMNFGTCLALGCARGNDIAPLAAAVERFYCIEPCREFWRSEIGGRPAAYHEPDVTGAISLPANSVDLATAIAVLQHIPNVTAVVKEIVRVLRPGGILLVRDAIWSMGDWSSPRKGLTQNQRGISESILKDIITNAGMRIDRVTYCDFPPLVALSGRLGVRPFQNEFVTRLDLALSALLRWHARYHRTSLLDRFAPASIGIVATKI